MIHPIIRRPICAVCQEFVEELIVTEDSASFVVELRAFCHGEVEVVRVLLWSFKP